MSLSLNVGAKLTGAVNPVPEWSPLPPVPPADNPKAYYQQLDAAIKKNLRPVTKAIRVEDGDVEALVYGPFGITTRKVDTVDAEGKKGKGFAWIHLPSGLRIAVFDDQTKARRALYRAVSEGLDLRPAKKPGTNVIFSDPNTGLVLRTIAAAVAGDFLPHRTPRTTFPPGTIVYAPRKTANGKLAPLWLVRVIDYQFGKGGSRGDLRVYAQPVPVREFGQEPAFLDEFEIFPTSVVTAVPSWADQDHWLTNAKPTTGEKAIEQALAAARLDWKGWTEANEEKKLSQAVWNNPHVLAGVKRWLGERISQLFHDAGLGAEGIIGSALPFDGDAVVYLSLEPEKHVDAFALDPSAKAQKSRIYKEVVDLARNRYGYRPEIIGQYRLVDPESGEALPDAVALALIHPKASSTPVQIRSKVNQLLKGFGGVPIGG